MLRHSAGYACVWYKLGIAKTMCYQLFILSVGVSPNLLRAYDMAWLDINDSCDQ